MTILIEDDIRAPMVHTHGGAEIQGTLRRAMPVEFSLGKVASS